MLSLAVLEGIYAMEQYLVRKGWERAPEEGPGKWIKFDGFGGYDLMGLEAAYELESDHDIN